MQKYAFIISFLAIAIISPQSTSTAHAAESAPCTTITVSLSIGSTDKKSAGAVTRLQDFLRTKGYLDHVSTGYFGPMTHASVKQFQTSEGIEAIGIVGPKTRAAIQRVSCTPTDAAPQAHNTLATPDTFQTSPLATPVTTTPVPAATNQAFDFDPAWRDPIVNILCTSNYGGGMTSGSGVIIDPRGIIITNAHVGAGQLFTNFPGEPYMSMFDCQVRTGSPAKPQYKAELLYLPKGWVEDSVKYMYESSDEGYVYGKDDYALLLITDTTDPNGSLPAVFPHMPIAEAIPSAGAPVYIAGYPASMLGEAMVARSLYMIVSPTTIDSVSGIASSADRDIISFGGTAAGQHGTSGGAVVSHGGTLAAMPTYTDAEHIQTTDDMSLNAITIDYVSRDLKQETGMTLDEFLTQPDLWSVAETFMEEDAYDYQKMYAEMWKEKEGVTIPGFTE